jgi:CheY-like chemotaxis protein
LLKALGMDRISRPTGSGVMQRPLRVLLVDDDRDGREMYAEFLKIDGFEVLEADNGAEGIDVAVQRKPDLIVMDLEMPIMGGIEAIERLRVDGRTRAIPVIVLSANGIFDHALAERAGCNTCLVKPCVPEDLEGTIRSLVDVSGQAAPRESVPG